ncbi:hypothetical protein MMC12_008133 [Toensbergia leucococca]|nr:hypothetical protein [Toensbergia leucococca]
MSIPAAASWNVDVDTDFYQPDDCSETSALMELTDADSLYDGYELEERAEYKSLTITISHQPETLSEADPLIKILTDVIAEQSSQIKALQAALAQRSVKALMKDVSDYE